MAKLPLYSCAALALAIVITGPAFADKKAKEAEIKALEEQLHQLHVQEKAALKNIDQSYDYVIRALEPKQVRQKLEETVLVLQNVHEVISIGDFDYGGNRHAAQESVKAAEHQVVKALKHDTAEERLSAAEHLQAAYRDVSKALAFSILKYGLGNGKDRLEPESRAAANVQLAAQAPKIGFAYRLLAAVDHDIADFKEERKILRAKRDAEKHELKEQYKTKTVPLEEKLKALKK